MNYSKSLDKREQVTEFREGPVVITIFKKVDLDNPDRVYYDFRVSKEFMSGEGSKLGPYLHLKDGYNTIKGLAKAMEWVDNQKRAESRQQQVFHNH